MVKDLAVLFYILNGSILYILIFLYKYIMLVGLLFKIAGQLLRKNRACSSWIYKHHNAIETSAGLQLTS